MSLISAFIILTPINYFTLDEFGVSFRGIIFPGILGVFCTGLAIPIIFSGIKIFGLRLHPVLRILFLCSERYGEFCFWEKLLHGK